MVWNTNAEQIEHKILLKMPIFLNCITEMTENKYLLIEYKM